MLQRSNSLVVFIAILIHVKRMHFQDELSLVMFFGKKNVFCPNICFTFGAFIIPFISFSCEIVKFYGPFLSEFLQHFGFVDLRPKIWETLG